MIGDHLSIGAGYSKLGGTDELSGGGGKSVLASRSAFSSFVAAVMSSPLRSFPLSVGIHVLLPSPGEVLMYRCAVQMSFSVASSNHSCQWSFLALKISLASLLRASLLALWHAWSGRARNLYERRLSWLERFLSSVSSLVHHLRVWGHGFDFGTCFSTVSRRARSMLLAVR